MRRKKKYIIIGTILVMAVAFATITTNLIMKGGLTIATNDKDYAIYFSKSVINAEDVSKRTISSNGQTLTFDAEMRELGQKTELDYEVTNASKNYDAKVTVECEVQDITEESTGLNVDDYLNIEYSNLEDVIPARSTSTGKITMTLKRSMVEDMKLGLNCNLTFDAEERENLAINTPAGNEPSNYHFSGYLVDENDDILANTHMVILGKENIYITSGEEGSLNIEGLDMGFHDIYLISGKTIEEIKAMSEEEVKTNALTKAKFTQSSKEIQFDNGYKIVDELVTKEFIVTFDAQGGTVTPTSKKVIKRELYGELPTPTLNGYNFMGWYTDTEYTTQISANQKVTISEDITLYAKWEAKTITVNFNSDGGNTISSKTVKYNANYGDLETPSKNGYNFLGWYLNNTLITSTTKVKSTTDVTLIAKWDAKKKNITVDNDGTPLNVEIDLTKPIVESLPTPSKEGYTFDGWYIDDVKISDDKVLGEDEEVSIKAKYTAKKYTITFNANAGSVTESSKEVTYDQAYSELPTPTKNGYNFVGWFTSKTGGTQVTSSTIVKITAAQTLYARWSAKTDITYTVKHWQQNVNSLDVPKNETNYTLVETESLRGTTDATVSPNTKNYDGFTSPSKESITVKEDGSAVLNYYYTRNSYTLTVNKDTGVSSVTSESSYKYGEEVNISYIIKDGYTFKDITGDKTSNTFTMPAKNTTISINTTENTYTITYNLDGGVVSGNPTTYKVTSNDITLNNPSKTGYTFMGWTGSNGSEKEASVTIAKGSTGNKTYTANFNPNTYTVSFDSNGGSPVATVLTVTYDATYGDTLPTPTREGYIFNGWYIEVSGGTQVTSTTKVDISENKTLYAHWTPISYTITYNLDGGVNNASNPTTYTVEDNVTILAPTKTGYKFTGWTGSNGTTPQTSVTIPEGSTGDKTYTANWTQGQRSTMMAYSDTKGFWQHKSDITKVIFEPTLSPKAGAAYTFDVSEEQNGSIMSYLVRNANDTDTSKYTLYIQGENGVIAPEFSVSLFSDFTNLTTIEGLEYLDTSKVTNMAQMFSYCPSLTSLDLSHFDTSKVIIMNSMFSSCPSLTSLDLSNFNTSNVMNMGHMFYDCKGLTSLDLSNFNTSNVTSMYSMFDGCSSLTSLDLSNFDTSKVTTMTYMFNNCSKLTSLDLSNFNTSKVTNMYGMFNGCSGLTSLDVSNFDTSNVTNMSDMFYNCSGLTNITYGTNFIHNSTATVTYMFNSCPANKPTHSSWTGVTY